MPVAQACRLPERVDDVRRGELERALRLLQGGRDAAEVMEALSRRLTNKLLHRPTRALRGLRSP